VYQIGGGLGENGCELKPVTGKASGHHHWPVRVTIEQEVPIGAHGIQADCGGGFLRLQTTKMVADERGDGLAIVFSDDPRDGIGMIHTITSGMFADLDAGTINSGKSIELTVRQIHEKDG
jgi:hypothetical protein